ncbi:hypothetical protein H8356DRAFT_1347350 [Neocallimastix lanati (nom. inval.)]|nr:hypothetical protein H8356DRAFT_1347350 [Neocallimastix sp. JGI-2020a]
MNKSYFSTKKIDKNKNQRSNFEGYNQNVIYEKYRKKVVTYDSDEHLILTTINSIELYYDSDSDSDYNNNYNYQRLEYKTKNNIKQINYNGNYCDNKKNTNNFHKENNIDYDLNKYFIKNINDSDKYNNINYKDLDMNDNILNNEITSTNNSNISNMNNSYLLVENEKSIIIEKHLNFDSTYNKNYQKTVTMQRIWCEITVDHAIDNANDFFFGFLSMRSLH